jgi:hypothetical protein
VRVGGGACASKDEAIASKEEAIALEDAQLHRKIVTSASKVGAIALAALPLPRKDASLAAHVAAFAPNGKEIGRDDRGERPRGRRDRTTDGTNAIQTGAITVAEGPIGCN